MKSWPVEREKFLKWLMTKIGDLMFQMSSNVLKFGTRIGVSWLLNKVRIQAIDNYETKLLNIDGYQ